MENEKSYVIAICDDSNFYLPNAEHIERNDGRVPWGVPDDNAAAKAAEDDGIRLTPTSGGLPPTRKLSEILLESWSPSRRRGTA